MEFNKINFLKIFIFISIGLTVVSIGFLFSTKNTIAQSWLSDYGYRAKIIVDGIDSGHTGYQMKIKVYSGEGTNTTEDAGKTAVIYLNNNAQNWPNDIAFTQSDGITEIYHWRENDTSPAIFWIKVDVPAAGNTTDYYIYYGNIDVGSTSDGDATFELFNVLGIKGFWHMDEDYWTSISPPTCTLSANPIDVEYGGISTLTWTVQNNPTSGAISPGISGSPDFTADGSAATNSIESDTTFVLTVENAAGSNTCSVTVNLKEMIWLNEYHLGWDKVTEFDRYADECTYGKDGKCYKKVSGAWIRNGKDYFWNLVMCDDIPCGVGHGVYEPGPVEINGKRLSVDATYGLSGYCNNCLTPGNQLGYCGFSSPGTYENIITAVRSCSSYDSLGTASNLAIDVCCDCGYVFNDLQVSKLPPR